jgi:nicotinate (nicotinamide) nucleotide adenylyltransferase
VDNFSALHIYSLGEEPRKEVLMKDVLIFGGAFNPPHPGHLKALLLVAGAHPWDEIWILPSGSRLDKQIGSWRQDRLALTEAFAEDAREQIRTPIRVEICELASRAPTSTYTTLRALEAEYPDYRFWLYVSSETVAQIKQFWVQGRRLWEEARFVVLPRPGFPLPPELPPNLILVDQPCVDASSASVRERAHAGQGIESLVTPRVLEVITERRMYE